MAITGKAYLNFLGGEVSPNAYKRLDMANNGKWFETAKNVYFGTTGDFQNRRGFRHIGEVYSGALSGDKIKLIPFVFNRSISYCIAINNNTFSVLKNGSFLLDDNSQKIEVEHPGLSLAGIDDISYCQIGDIVYITSNGQDSIYTIKRMSETEWVWEKFSYEIPPMRDENQDPLKTLTFSVNNSYQNMSLCTVDLGGVLNPFSQVSVSFFYYDSGQNAREITILSETSSSITFASKDDFASYFNQNNSRTDLVSTCEANNNTLNFYCPPDAQALASQFFIRVYVANGNGVSNVISGGNPFQEQNTYGEYHDYSFQSNSYITSAVVSYKVINTGVVTRNYSFSSAKTLAEFVNFIQSETRSTGQQYLTFISLENSTTIRTYCRHTSNHGAYGFESVYFDSVSYVVPSSGAVRYQSPISTAIASGTSTIYNVNASFDFFSDKNIGSFFCVNSIYSPSREGAAGQNKNYYQDTGSFPDTTDVFWSNGNWRFVTSGLFKGSIELQYSYDGQSWYTHRTFSSTIRTENNVSYGTNYNEYGSMDVDDNVLIRLKFNLSSQNNLCVLLDTESFKNRSYYKVLQKNSSTSAVVECVRYNVGTPGISTYNTSTGDYNVSPISEWAESAWSSSNGYPKKTFFYQNRLAFANTDAEPYAIWFSRTDNFKDFSTKIEYTDDDPITIHALRATGVSEINTIASAKKLFVFTADHEEGIADEGALTQANKQLLGFTYYGSEPIETRNVSNKIIFIERGGHAARALTYDFSQDNYEAIDLTIPYKHLLTDEKIIATDYLPGDYKTFLMLTSSGRLICFKYLPEQKIEACSWFKHASGTITNICVVATTNGYDLYIGLDSGTHKFLEYINIENGSGDFYLDSYKTYSSENAMSSITDSNYFVPGVEYTVLSGNDKYTVLADNTASIELKTPSVNVSVGIKYVSEATLIEPNLLYQNGSTSYNRKNMFKAFFTYEDSVGFKVGVKNKERSFKQVFSLPLSSIDVEREKASGERNFILQSSYLEPNMLSFVQEEPYKMHITNSEVEVDYGGK